MPNEEKGVYLKSTNLPPELDSDKQNSNLPPA